MTDFSHIIDNNQYALMGRGEFQAILEEMEKFNPKIILEIGTRQGYSSRAFYEAFHPELLITVDIIPESDMPGGIGGKVNDSKVKYVVGDSTKPETIKEVERLLGEEPVDILFIDGSHMEEDVKKDFWNYSGLVKVGGLIIMHDVVEQLKKDLRQKLSVQIKIGQV